MATNSEAMASSSTLGMKTILVCFHEMRRPISFEAKSTATEERHAVFEAVKEVFGDVFAEGRFDTSSFVLQAKSEDWGGEFVDIIDDQLFGDKQVVRIVCKVR